MKKACIFDLDGTLAMTLDSMAYAANQVMARFGLAALPRENFRNYCGDGADMLVKRCLLDAGDGELVHFPEARTLYRELFNADPLYKVEIYDGMAETLQKLKQAGVRLAVCSNKPHEATVQVVQTLFGDTFDAAIGQSEKIRKKPAPDSPLKAAAVMGVRPEECIYLGDSGTDMRTGKAAGMLTAGVLWGYRSRTELLENGADILLEKPADIWQLYEETK